MKALLESQTRQPKVYFNLKISVTLSLNLNSTKEYTISLSDFHINKSKKFTTCDLSRCSHGVQMIIDGILPFLGNIYVFFEEHTHTYIHIYYTRI